MSFFEPHVSFLFYGMQEAENVRLSHGKQDARGRERDVIQTSHSLSDGQGSGWGLAGFRLVLT